MTIRAVRLPIALLMETLASYAAAALLVAVGTAGDGAGPTLFAIAAVVFGSFAVGRLARQMDIDENALSMLGVVVTLIALLIVAAVEYAAADPAGLRNVDVRADAFFGIIALLACWIRGIMRGQEGDAFEGALNSAAIGLIPIVFAAAAQPEVRGIGSLGNATFGPVALVYLLLALCVLALYRAPDPDQTLSTAMRRWFPLLPPVLGGALGIAALAAAIDPGDAGFLSPLGVPLALLGEAFARFILGPIFDGVAWFFDAVIPDGSEQEQPRPQPDRNPEEEKDEDRPLWLQILTWGMAGVVAFGMALLVLGAIVGLALLFRRRDRTERGERRERVEGQAALGDDLSGLFDAFARRFRRSPRARSDVAVRRLYREILDAAEGRGLARPPSATPITFAPGLDTLFASDAPSAISEAFAESRYGARTFDDAFVADLRRRWQTARDA